MNQPDDASSTHGRPVLGVLFSGSDPHHGRPWTDRLRAALEAHGARVWCVDLGGPGLSAEQALFHVANELADPQVLILASAGGAAWDVREMADRLAFQLPGVPLVRVGAPADERPVRGFNLVITGEELRDDDLAVLARRLLALAGPPTQPGAQPSLASVVPRVQMGERRDGFRDVRMETPVAPKSLPPGQDVAGLLARPRPRPARVLLVVPSQLEVYGVRIRPAYPALGVLSVAALLERAGHHVVVVDMDADEMDNDDVVGLLVRERIEVLGVTAVTATWPNAVQLARAARRRLPSLPTIIGGIHATVDPMGCVSERAFDFVAVGEAECTALELVDALAVGRRDMSNIPGLVFRGPTGTPVSTGARSLLPDLDELPPPALHLVRSLGRYAPADAQHLPVAPVMVSRGCPGQCTYCQTKNIFGRRTRFRSPERVVEEIRHRVQVLGVKEIHFLDDVLTASRPFVRRFCALMRAEPYRVQIEVANGLRADMVNEEILADLQSVGLQNVGFGIETGSERVGRLIKKGISKDQTRRAVSIAKKLGLETWGFFVLGLPGDDEQSIRETVDFAMELDPKYAKFLILKPFPGSEAYYQLDEQGLIDNRDYARYGVYTAPVHHLPGLSSARILQLQQQAFRRFYLRPEKLREHFAGIRSPGKLLSFARGAWFVAARTFRGGAAGLGMNTGG